MSSFPRIVPGHHQIICRAVLTAVLDCGLEMSQFSRYSPYLHGSIIIFFILFFYFIFIFILFHFFLSFWRTAEGHGADDVRKVKKWYCHAQGKATSAKLTYYELSPKVTATIHKLCPRTIPPLQLDTSIPTDEVFDITPLHSMNYYILYCIQCFIRDEKSISNHNLPPILNTQVPTSMRAPCRRPRSRL